MKLKKKEIELLADDIKNNINQTIEITKFSLTAATAILAFAASRNNVDLFSALGCLLPIPILMIAITMIINRRQNVLEKATFLNIFGGSDYVYELFLSTLRHEKLRKPTSFSITLFKMLIVMIFISVILALIITLYAVFIPADKIQPITCDHLTSHLHYLILGVILILMFIGCFVYSKYVLNQLRQVLMGPNIQDGGCPSNEDTMADQWNQVLEIVKKSDKKRIPKE